MGSFPPPRLLIICLAIATCNLGIVEAQCYYPGGAWAEDQFPCNKYAYTSLCCPTGWTCFSNNLCVATDPSIVSSDLPSGTSIRGTCTNPLWNDTVCGDFCLNDPVSSNNGSVVPCGENKYCCQPDSADGTCDCSTGKGTFHVSDGTAQTIIGVVGLQYTSIAESNSATQSSSVAVTVSTLPSTSASPISSSYSPSSSQSSSISTLTSARSGSTTSVAPATGTGSSSTASPTNQQILDTSTPVTQRTAFKAGVGAAAGVVFAIIAGCIIFLLIRWWQRRHDRDLEVEETSGANQWNPNPAISEIPSQVPPNPHPYGANPYSEGQSRTALAEQVRHNRRTPGPIEIDEQHNPYSEHFMAGSTGR